MKKIINKAGYGRTWVNILLKMKLTAAILLFCLASSGASTYAQNTRLSISSDSKSILELFREIEEKSEFYFFYQKEDLKELNNVTVDIENATVMEILDKALAGTKLQYKVLDRYIIVRKSGDTFGNDIIAAQQQQQRSVSGKVTDDNSQPLPGVTVVIKGTTQGTVTSVEGEYSISNIPENATLQFSFVGMKTQEVAVGSQTTINVSLEGDAIGLEEVVAIGYGTQKKATLTGSVSGVQSEELMKTPTANLTNSLAGLMPGLVTMNRSGQPGADNSTFLVRGNSTTGDNTPLVLVDGVAESGWQRINSNDIESISVLKDAAAAIYGVQAANGVILITTKRGSTGKPVFNFTYNQGLVQPTRVPEMASSATLAQYGNEYLERTGFERKFTDEEIQKYRDGTDPRYPNTNWPGEVLKKFSLQESANFNIRGGSEIIRYSMSSSYQHKDDIIKDGIHDFKNYTIRSNIDTDVTDNITLSLDLNLSKDAQHSPVSSNWFYIYQTNPQYPVYYPGGYPSAIPSDYGENPVITNTGGSGYDHTDVKRFTGKFSYDINLPIIEGLGLDGYFVYSDNYSHRKNWKTPWKYYGYNWDTEQLTEFLGGTTPRPELGDWFTSNNSYLFNFRAKYERQFTDHYINTFIAAEQSKGESNTLYAFRRDFISSALDEIFAGSAANMNNDGYSSLYARRNVFGRLSYNFKEKYLLDFNFRYDGSYKFPTDGRWGFFPGISAAWRISEEDFFSVNAFNNLKIRASHGQIGNDAIDAFQYLQQYNLSSIGYHFGAPNLSSPQPAIYAGVSPNPNITWEVSTITNIGLDGILYNNLLGFSFDVFKQRRTNILTTRALELPYYTGLILPNQNIGIVENKGIELELSHRNTINRLSYKVAGNFSFARSNVVDVSEAENVPEYQKAEGHILGAQLLYEAIGIFRTKEELATKPAYPGSTVGDLIYKDVNDDGKINNADMVRMDKSVIPEITYGFNLSVQYGNFDLFAHFAGQGMAWWYIHENARVDQNSLKELLDNRYTPGSMDSKYPWIPQFETIGADISGMRSTMWLQNAAFLRLKTFELSYNLPQDLIQRINVGNIRVFVNGSNLFTLSKIKWFDPEGSNERGVFYPQSKIYNLGVQIKF